MCLCETQSSGEGRPSEIMGMTRTQTHSLTAPALFLQCSLPQVNMFPWKQSAQDWPSLEVVALHRDEEKERDGGVL